MLIRIGIMLIFTL